MRHRARFRLISSALGNDRTWAILSMTLAGAGIAVTVARFAPVAALGAVLGLILCVISLQTFLRSRNAPGSKTGGYPLERLAEFVVRWPLPTAGELLWRGEATIDRQVDIQIAEALRTQQFVIVVGARGSGKTHSLFKVLAQNYSDHHVIIPAATAGSLAAIVSLGPPVDVGPLPAILLLDDLDDEFELDGGDLDALRRIAARPPTASWIKVAATSSQTSLSRSLRAFDAFQALAERATVVQMQMQLTPLERDSLPVPDRVFADQRFLQSMPPHILEAAALVHAWHKTGVGRGITPSELHSLALEAAPALAETIGASAELAVSSGLMMLAGGQSAFLASDTVGELLPIKLSYAESAWNFAMRRASPDEALRMGMAAQARGDAGKAEQALLAAAEFDADPISYEAWLQLGEISRSVGDYTRAMQFVNLAGATKDETVHTRALYTRALIALDLSCFEEALELFTRLAQNSDAKYAARASNGVARSLLMMGRLQEAEGVLRRAADAMGDPGTLFLLGSTLIEMDRVADAEVELSKAAALGHTSALVTLGKLAERRNDLPAALTAFQRAADTGSSEAAFRLGALLSRDGNDEAESWLEFASTATDSGTAADASLALARALQSRGREADAQDAYQRAMDLAADASHQGLASEYPGRLAATREVRVLEAIRSLGALTEDQIASAALLSPGSVQAILRSLVDVGAIQPVASDAVRVRYALTVDASARSRPEK
jgi:tetratricopeptide (TPR) repeat protein